MQSKQSQFKSPQTELSEKLDYQPAKCNYKTHHTSLPATSLEKYEAENRTHKRSVAAVGYYSSSEDSSSASASQVRNGSAALRTFLEVERSVYFLLALLPHLVTTSSLTRS